jgi:hypothetical protein
MRIIRGCKNAPTMAIALLGAGICLLGSCMARSADAEESKLAAHYDFSQGSGATLTDVSGGGNNGRIVGARWVKAGGRAALSFSSGSYVDCGKNLNLDGDTTMVAWVKLMGDPWPNDKTNAVIAANAGYADNGFVLRVEGGTSRMLYFTNIKRSYSIANSHTPLSNNAIHQIVLVKESRRVTWYLDGVFDGRTGVNDGPKTGDSFYISEPAQSFQGLMHDVKIYRRALSAAEIKKDFGVNGGKYGLDVSWFGKIRMTPYFYFDQGKVVVTADLAGVAPLEPGDTISLSMGPADKPLTVLREVTAVPELGKDEYTLDLPKLTAGKQQLQIALRHGGAVKTQESAYFDYPPVTPAVPAPKDTTVSALPAAPARLPFSISVADGGGFTLKAGGCEFPVESRFSYPNGGENVLSVGKPAGEAQWQVKVTPLDASTYQVAARGQHYRILRTIRLLPNRVSVADLITNAGRTPIGIILKNQVGTQGQGVADVYLGGNKATGTRDIKINPTVFLSKPGLGLGLIALDDVYVVQARGYADAGHAGIFTDNFALDQGATYSVEWALYPNGTGDYYGFINEVRRDEGRNGVTVEGGFAFISVGTVPSREYVDIRNLKYFSAPCLSRCIDDPTISLEGIEFIEYPKVRHQLKEQFDAVRKIKPGLKFMFHIAHALYATNQPRAKWPDSMLVNAAGKQFDYYGNDGSYYGSSYFSKEKLDQGWRWWIFYPTLRNSFGKAMVKSVDLMMDEIGCNGAFMDGFMWTYGSDYTYNEWDKHSADIDPQTKTITRTKGSTLLLSQECLAAYVHRFNERGGTVVANYPVYTRTIARERMVCDQECKIGPDIHLTTTPITLGRSGQLNTEAEVYKDALEALQTGNLYFYYGEGNLTYETLPSREFPLTYEEIHAGYIKGRERLVTMNSGVYGWTDDQDLHLCCRFDDRGAPAAHNFLTTVDSRGVRTRIELKKDESAVVAKIPVTISADSSVNLVCRQYDANGIKLSLNGAGIVKFAARSGDFILKPNTRYTVTATAEQKVTTDAEGVLAFPLELRGEAQVSIQ